MLVLRKMDKVAEGRPVYVRNYPALADDIADAIVAAFAKHGVEFERGIAYESFGWPLSQDI